MADHLRKVQYLKFLRFFFFYKYLLLVGGALVRLSRARVGWQEESVIGARPHSTGPKHTQALTSTT